MRKNKFRIYDTNNKEYLDSEDYQIDCNTGEIYEAIGIRFDSGLDAGIVLAYGLIAEEFTGVLDKNGVEIYENDTDELGWIVTYLDDGEDFSSLGLPCGWYLQRDNFESYMELICHDNDFEIKGNIHDGK